MEAGPYRTTPPSGVPLVSGRRGGRGGPIYLSLQKTSASASRLSIYLSKFRAPLRFQPYLRKKNAILLSALLAKAAPFW